MVGGSSVKPGSLIQISLPHGILNLGGGIRDDEEPYETGESLFHNEIGLILETYHGTGNNVYHRILTPRNHIGWIHTLQVEEL